MIMNFQPKYYKTHPLSQVLTLESVVDRKGNMMYAVSSSRGVNECKHYLFMHLSSAIDFISTNFCYDEIQK